MPFCRASLRSQRFRFFSLEHSPCSPTGFEHPASELRSLLSRFFYRPLLGSSCALVLMPVASHHSSGTYWPCLRQAKQFQSALLVAFINFDPSCQPRWPRQLPQRRYLCIRPLRRILNTTCPSGAQVFPRKFTVKFVGMQVDPTILSRPTLFTVVDSYFYSMV